MAAFDDLFELALKGADDTVATAIRELPSSVRNDVVMALRKGEDFEEWKARTFENAGENLDQAHRDILNGKDFEVRAKAAAAFGDFSDEFTKAFNSKVATVDVNALIKQADISASGLSKAEIKEVADIYKARVERRDAIINKRMLRLEKQNDPTSVRTEDEILADKDLRDSVLEDWAKRYAARAEVDAAKEAIVDATEFTARPRAADDELAPKTAKGALDDLALPSRDTSFNTIKLLTMKTFLERWFKDGFFKAFSAEGMNRAIPIKVMKARSTDVTDPVVQRVDQAMHDSGMSHALLGLDSYLLKNPNIDDIKLNAILQKFADVNQDTLKALSEDIEKLRDHVATKFKVNDEVGLRNDLLQDQKDAMLRYLDDMKDMYDDLARGSNASYISDLKSRLNEIQEGKLTVAEVQNSPVRLFKGAYNAFQAEVRLSPTRTIPGTDISATKQWVKQLSRQFEEGVYDEHAHMARADIVRKHLNFNFLNQDNVERGVYNQFADLFSNRKPDGSLVYDFVGDVKPVSAFFNNTVEFIQNGYGSEILFQVARLKRLAQAPGQGDAIPLPPAGEFADQRVKYNAIRKETPAEAMYFDKIEEILEAEVLKGQGHEKSYWFFERFKKNLTDVNRQNTHLAAVYAEPYELALRFQNHDAFSTPGWDIYFKQYMKFKASEAYHYFAGAHSFTPQTKMVHGVEMNSHRNPDVQWLKETKDPKSGDLITEGKWKVPYRIAYRGLLGGMTSSTGRTIMGVTGVPLALAGAGWYTATNMDDENLGTNAALAGLDTATAPWRYVSKVVTSPYQLGQTVIGGLGEAWIQDEHVTDTYMANTPLVWNGVDAFWDFGQSLNPTNNPAPETPEAEQEAGAQQDPASKPTTTLQETKDRSSELVQRMEANKALAIEIDQAPVSYDILVNGLRAWEANYLKTIDQSISDSQTLNQADRAKGFQELRDQVTSTVSSTVTALNAERDAFRQMAEEGSKLVSARDRLIQGGTDKVAADALIVQQRDIISEFEGKLDTALRTRGNDVLSMMNSLQGGYTAAGAVTGVPGLTVIPGMTPPPGSTTTQPGSSTTTQPGSTTTQPGSTTTQPGSSTTTQPGSTTTQPGSTTTQPGSSTTTQPGSSTTTQPGSTTTQPGSTTTTTQPLSPLQQAQQKAGASEQYFNSVVSSSRNKLNILDQHLDEIEKLKDQLYSEGKTTQADALSRALDTARAGQVAAESTLSDIKAKEQDIRQLREQINALTDNRDINQANSILAQMKIIQEDVKKMGEEINTVGRQVYDDLQSSEDLRDHVETQRLIRNISGGENGLVYQIFGSDDPNSQSVAGSYLSLAWKKVNDVGDWWGETKRNARSQSERNMLNAVETGGGILAGLVIFNMINKNLFDNQIGGVMKWGILATIAGYFLHRSGKIGDEMAKSSTRNPFHAQTNYGSTSTANPPTGGSGGSGSSARSSHTPFSTRPNSTQNAPDADANNSTANNAVPIRDKTGKVVDHIKVDLSGGIDQMTVQSHAGGMPSGQNAILVSPAAKSEISRVVSGQCKFMVPDGEMEGSITIESIKNSDGTSLQGPVTVDFTCPAANDPTVQNMAAGQ